MNAPATLEPHFQTPSNWQWSEFERATNRRIRYGFASPETPKALIIALPGLNEMAEKYFEIAHQCLDNGYAFCVMDWFGQGASGRHIEGSTKRHSDGFDHDIEDCAHLINNLPQELTALPKIMLAHSMGGNLGARYLIKHPDTFLAAAMSAPMLGIDTISDLPRWFQKALSGALNLLMGKTYVTFHGMKNREKNQTFKGNDLSSDPERFALLNTWMSHDETLRADDVTFGWVYHALRSCYAVEQSAHTIQTPILCALAGDESIVHNASTHSIMSKIQNAELLEITGALHEVMMERDELRDQFFGRFFPFIETALNENGA